MTLVYHGELLNRQPNKPRPNLRHPPVLQLGRLRALMRRHLLRLLQIPASQLTPSGKIEIEAPELPRTLVVGIFRENGKLSSRGTQVA
jgi:hypothetical protein